MESTTKLRSPSRDEIPGLLEELAASGMTIAAFARERGLATWKLYPAARKLAGGEPRRRKQAVERSTFAPVSVIRGVQTFEIDLGSKGLVRIPEGFDPADLRRLLEVLHAC